MAYGQPVSESGLSITGALTTSSSAVRPFHNRYRILGALSAVVTAVATAAMVVDVKIARAADPTTFTTIFAAGDTKPSIADLGTAGTSTPPTSITDIQPGDLVKIVLTGSFSAATDLTVTLLLDPL